MKDETINIEELIPDDQNANKGTERGGELIYNSFQHYGAGRSILVDKDNRIIAGNKSTVGAKKAGIQKVRIIETDGSELIALKRTDVSLDDPNGRGMAIMDNRTAEVNMEIDIEVIQEHAEEQGIDIEEWGYEEGDLEESGSNGDGTGGNTNVSENNYSTKIKAPVYEPNNEKPESVEVFDEEKVLKLEAKIKAANLPKEEEYFLLKAAQRHRVFNYEKIADYYAHSSKDVQELMEDSALVIIDFNKAIEDGYVKLAEEVAAQYGIEYGDEE